MKAVVVASLAASMLATSSEALQLSKRESPKVISMPIERRTTTRHTASDRIRKRSTKTVSQVLDNFESGSLYFANITIGTPAQKFRFHVDTGSSDLWSNSPDSQLCQEDAQAEAQGAVPCSVSGTYNANKSSTYEYISSDFSIDYADGTGARGDYVSDTVRFGQMGLTGQQFGVGYRSSSSEGVMGIGFPTLEVAVVKNEGQPYANIPMKMVSEGLINTAVYSLWLDDIFSSTGNILFGGVDQDKYIGDLKTLPIVKDQDELVEMLVPLSGLSIVDGSKNSSALSQPITVLLDSGSTLSYLPEDTASQIYNAVGATYDQQSGAALCNCDVSNSSTTLDFLFDGKAISVQMEELVLTGGPGRQGSDQACIFGVMPQSNSDSSSSGDGSDASYTLGDTFIRNAYVVYDLTNGEISLAQTNFQSKQSDIHEASNSTDATNLTGNGKTDSSKSDSDSGANAVKPAWVGVLAVAVGIAALL